MIHPAPLRRTPATSRVRLSTSPVRSGAPRGPSRARWLPASSEGRPTRRAPTSRSPTFTTVMSAPSSGLFASRFCCSSATVPPCPLARSLRRGGWGSVPASERADGPFACLVRGDWRSAKGGGRERASGRASERADERTTGRPDGPFACFGREEGSERANGPFLCLRQGGNRGDERSGEGEGSERANARTPNLAPERGTFHATHSTLRVGSYPSLVFFFWVKLRESSRRERTAPSFVRHRAKNHFECSRSCHTLRPSRVRACGRPQRRSEEWMRKPTAPFLYSMLGDLSGLRWNEF